MEFPDIAETAFDAAACIGCGTCVAVCPNSAAQLFTATKVSHLNLLPQRRRARSSLSTTAQFSTRHWKQPSTLELRMVHFHRDYVCGMVFLVPNLGGVMSQKTKRDLSLVPRFNLFAQVGKPVFQVLLI